jgi:hypothetical protein
MKKLISVFVVLLFCISIAPLYSQNLVLNNSVTGICLAGNNINRIYVPPPEKFLKKSGSKSGGDISVYYTGFPDEQKAAMEYAVSILETLLPADTRMTILASWESISTEGVLGHSSITGFLGGWGIDALNPYAYYPISLAEKIAGESINTDEGGDFKIVINKDINWYLGTDGATPVTRYDLVTVVLHEIIHGLGFYDSMNATRTKAYYGFPVNLMLNDSVSIINDTIPMIYDTFLESVDEKRLTDTIQFINNSAELLSQVTGGQLYFDGVLLSNYAILNSYPAERARLYAPSTFASGSSVSHLDEDATDEPNTLMTPFIAKGEAIHDPGDLTFSMLGDMGWINTRIVHQPMDDTEDNITDIDLSVIIQSDTLYNKDKVGVVFSFDNFNTIDTLYMTSFNSDDTFDITINLPSYNTELQYYFFAEDCFLRLYRSPALYDKIRYSVYVGADTVKPDISHTPVAYYLESADSVSFVTTVTDNKEVDTVYIEYKINNNTSNYIGLVSDDSDTYKAEFNAGSGLFTGGDSIQYRIFAVDNALSPNTAVLPETGYFTIDIEDIAETIISYSTDFTDASDDFFTIGFEIDQPSKFNSPALHTKHPYESPGENGMSIEYIAMLRHPLKFNESGMLIEFKEVVLVEPGETGVLYGSEDFYDYVIVEGSRDFGKNWFDLIDGYDSRYDKSWESAYNSSMDIDQNSTYVPAEAMLIKHSILYNPTDNLAAGDTLMLRFRLYSDPLANGWGWVIEDLNINSLVDAVEKISHDKMKVYPNPGKGLIKIADVSDNVSFKPYRFSVVNSAGIPVLNGLSSGSPESIIDISGHPSGFYIILLYLDDGLIRIKYSLIN